MRLAHATSSGTKVHSARCHDLHRRDGGGTRWTVSVSMVSHLITGVRRRATWRGPISGLPPLVDSSRLLASQDGVTSSVICSGLGRGPRSSRVKTSRTCETVTAYDSPTSTKRDGLAATIRPRPPSTWQLPGRARLRAIHPSARSGREPGSGATLSRPSSDRAASRCEKEWRGR